LRVLPLLALALALVTAAVFVILAGRRRDSRGREY
jgi:hypothetical protein